MYARTGGKPANILVLSLQPAPPAFGGGLDRSDVEVTFLNPSQAPSRSELVHAVIEADLVICCGAEPENYYLLGLADAVGKRAILWNRSGVPESLRKLGVSLSTDEPEQWDLEKLTQSSGPTPLVKADKRPVRWSLSGELRANISEITKVQARDLMFAGILHDLHEKSLSFTNCRTEVYDSEIAQWTLTRAHDAVRRCLAEMYGDFGFINNAAAHAREHFTVQNVQRYLTAIRTFERGSMSSAEDVLTYLLDSEL